MICMLQATIRLYGIDTCHGRKIERGGTSLRETASCTACCGQKGLVLQFILNTTCLHTN